MVVDFSHSEGEKKVRVEIILVVRVVILGWCWCCGACGIGSMQYVNVWVYGHVQCNLLLMARCRISAQPAFNDWDWEI